RRPVPGWRAHVFVSTPPDFWTSGTWVATRCCPVAPTRVSSRRPKGWGSGSRSREGTMPNAGVEWARRRAPGVLLGAMAAVVFLGGLGSVDLWGKREQRASAEAIDTIDRGHWLVAEIQGRPRLEKPPLPRWTIATLMILSGRRDEWVVRLPSALSALG